MNKKELDLSIIIVSYNTKDLTVDCVRSIFDTKLKVSFEVIVVDNGSEDDSVVEISNLKAQNSNLSIITNDENLGFSKANNQGIKVAKGKYVLLLNSDTKVTKGAIDSLVNFAQKTPDAGVVGAKLLNKDGSVQHSCFNFPTICRAINQYWLGKGKFLDKFSPKSMKPVIVDSLVGAAFLIAPKALEKIGGLDERYFFFYEDFDYCRSVKNLGLNVYYLPTAEIYHYHGASGKKLATSNDQWRRLIPSSKIYHGLFKHYLLNFIIWSGQKWQRLFS